MARTAGEVIAAGGAEDPVVAGTGEDGIGVAYAGLHGHGHVQGGRIAIA